MLIKVLIILGIILIFSIILFTVRKDRFRSGGIMGNALQEFHSAFDPGVKYTLIEKQKDHIQEDESGEPPFDDKGNPQ